LDCVRRVRPRYTPGTSAGLRGSGGPRCDCIRPERATLPVSPQFWRPPRKAFGSTLRADRRL